MNSELNLQTKILVLINILVLIFSQSAFADPALIRIDLPPASAALVTDPDLVKQIAVGRDEDPVWCYSTDANAILISAPEREREKCKLKLDQQKQRLEALHKLEISTLNIEIESLTNKYNESLLIKDQEIQNLTAAALKRPNDYSFWWASGGFAAGVLTVLSILWVAK